MSVQAAYNYVLHCQETSVFPNFKITMYYKSVQAKSGTVPVDKFLDSVLILTAFYLKLITSFTNSGDCYQVLKGSIILNTPPARMSLLVRTLTVV